MLENPNPDTAGVTVTYYREFSSPVVKTYAMRASSRLNILVNTQVSNSAVGMKVESASAIYAERVVYSRLDGHASHGIAALSQTWYFAEGSTAAPFQTWLLLVNPQSASARVTVSFLRESGTPVVRAYTLAPQSRMNVYVNNIVPNAAIATTIVSDLPIVAERSMYFGNGSHGSPGVVKPAQNWYLAEGFTGGGYDTWILLANPGDTAAQTTVAFLLDNGALVTRSYSVNPRSRLNVYANWIVPNSAFATQVTASQPIVVERAMYFGASNARGGHSSEAATQSATVWHLPEGSTQSPFNTFVLIMNPGDTPANVVVNFLREAAPAFIQTYVVAPNSRATVWVNKLIAGVAFSTIVSADQPVVVERAMYFNNNSGGTVSLGIPGIGTATQR